MKLSLLLLLLLSAGAWAQAPKGNYQGQGIEMSVSVRNAEQLRAFYGARGLPAEAVTEITRHCFITVGIYNGRKDILWMEPENWRVIDMDGKDIPRVSRQAWEEKWEKLKVPDASRATFGWTLLPESRDLQPDEPVGGNFVIVATQGSFTLQTSFATGKDKKGRPVKVSFSGLRCLTP